MATQWNAEDESAEEARQRAAVGLALSAMPAPPDLPHEPEKRWSDCLQDYEFDAEEGGEEELFEDDDEVNSRPRFRSSVFRGMCFLQHLS